MTEVNNLSGVALLQMYVQYIAEEHINNNPYMSCLQLVSKMMAVLYHFNLFGTTV
jgi:hypothetical protein